MHPAAAAVAFLAHPGLLVFALGSLVPTLLTVVVGVRPPMTTARVEDGRVTGPPRPGWATNSYLTNLHTARSGAVLNMFCWGIQECNF